LPHLYRGLTSYCIQQIVFEHPKGLFYTMAHNSG
jgi:hypothetical protein